MKETYPIEVISADGIEIFPEIDCKELAVIEPKEIETINPNLPPFQARDKQGPSNDDDIVCTAKINEANEIYQNIQEQYLRLGMVLKEIDVCGMERETSATLTIPMEIEKNAIGTFEYLSNRFACNTIESIPKIENELKTVQLTLFGPSHSVIVTQNRHTSAFFDKVKDISKHLKFTYFLDFDVIEKFAHNYLNRKEVKL